MTTKYLYLDDDNKTIIQAFVDRVSIPRKLEITQIHPSQYRNNIDELIQELNNYQGLILDWRLDMTVSEDGNKFAFRAGALAQEIRSRETEKTTKPIPIILWTTNDRFDDFYNRDTTSHDLFDRIYVKEKIASNGDDIGHELLSLQKGYEAVKNYIRDNSKDFCSLLKISKNSHFLDIRIQQKYKNGEYPVHEYARFILKEMLDRPGPLLDEKLLAARLGIDLDDSADWPNLLEILALYQYKGPFGDKWIRWWSYGIEEDWWFSELESEYSLSSLAAAERVEVIKEKTELTKLASAQPIREGYQTRFFAICEETKQPLDKLDGVIIEESSEPAPWQDRRYLSIDIALERSSERFRPHATELERLAEIRKSRG
jgi:hypothetical protein